MKEQTFGFAGGGRITRIFLQAMQRQQQYPKNIIVSDPNLHNIKKLQSEYPDAGILAAGLQDVAAQDVIFLAVHPPHIGEVCKEMAGFVKTSAVVISLAPVVTSNKLAAMLGTRRLVRMIPNAASYMNSGYNPVWFSKYIGETEKNLLLEYFKIFGECPLVDEEKLDAYAIIVAMGPTYLWPQLNELHKLGLEFGLTEDELVRSIQAMTRNTIDLLYNSDLDYEKVMDLVPVKPLGESEAMFRELYHSKLSSLYKKLKGLE